MISFSNTFQVQLALEQHEFELHKSTYTWIFFNKYTVGPLYLRAPIHGLKQPQIANLIHNLWLVESEDSNPWIWRVGYGTGAYSDFGIICGSYNQSPANTKGRLYFQNNIFSTGMFLFCNVVYQLEMKTPLLLMLCEKHSNSIEMYKVEVKFFL